MQVNEYILLTSPKIRFFYAFRASGNLYATQDKHVFFFLLAITNWFKNFPLVLLCICFISNYILAFSGFLRFFSSLGYFTQICW